MGGKTGLCISAHRRGVNLRQERCKYGNTMVFRKFRRRGGWVFQAKNGLVLDVYHGRMHARSKLIGWSRHGGSNQVWKLRRTRGRWVRMISEKGRNWCFDDRGKAHIHSPYWLWRCVNTRNQWFTFTRVNTVWKVNKQFDKTNWFYIRGKTGRCVAAYNNNQNATQRNCYKT